MNQNDIDRINLLFRTVWDTRRDFAKMILETDKVGTPYAAGLMDGITSAIFLMDQWAEGCGLSHGEGERTTH